MNVCAKNGLHTKKIAVVGATGRVGREMLSILNDFSIPHGNICAVASLKSKGSVVLYGETHKITVQAIEEFDFSEIDIALFSAGSDVSKVYARKAADLGCIVIDNTSYFRMFENIALIVPEVNFEDRSKYSEKNIIANPNCSTIQMVMALKPLHDEFILKEVNVSTYQATSGAGQKGIEELLTQTKGILSGNKAEVKHFKKQIAFNVIPQIDVFTDSLYTKEELKMMNETRKILNIPDLDITSTCVRVPVITGHSESILAKFEKDIDLEYAKKLLCEFNGVKVVDDIDNYSYITPIESASKNEVFISRLRKHPSNSKALLFWCVSDNVRKGAALNAVQIAYKICCE